MTDLEKGAYALNAELERIQTACNSVHAREQEIRDLLEIFPRAAVAAIADVRGFHNLARLARKTIREAPRS